MAGTFRGVVIEESLQNRDCLQLLHILQTRALEIAEPTRDQPARWTVTDFEVESAEAGTLAASLSKSLIAGPWYVDFNDGDRTYVIFAGRIFSYERGDDLRLEQARSFARSVGIPEAQIDWPVPD